MRVWCVTAALAATIVVFVQPVQAQRYEVGAAGMTLPEALAQLRTQAGVDVVYAQRLVEGRTVQALCQGNRAQSVLTCLLEGSGLRAQRVRRRQYVLVPAAPSPEASETSPALPSRAALAGFVLDAESGQVLSGAHVTLPALQLGVVSNHAGYFAISDLPREAYRVRFSYLGYAALDTLVEAGRPPLSVRLAPLSLGVGGVVVEAERASAAPPVPGLIALPVRQLERLPGLLGEQDLFQALQWLPGVRKSGELGGALLVRGGEPDQNLYLLDGAPVYHPWHAFSLVSTFQTETFKEVQLYRGLFPAEYGGRLASVLDAEMRDGRVAQPQATAALSVLSGRFRVESPLTAKSSFMVAGRRSYLDQLVGRRHAVEDATTGRRDTLRTGYYFYDVSAKLAYRPSVRHQLSVSYYRGRDVLDLRLPFDLSLDFSSWLRPADLFFELDHSWGNRLASVRYQYLPSNRWFVTTTAYRSTYSAAEGALIQPTSSASLASVYRVRLQDLGLGVDVDYYHSAVHAWRAGLLLVDHRLRSSLDAEIERSPGAVDDLAEESRLHGVEAVAYVRDLWRPSPRWRLMPGLRLSAFSSGGYVRLSPRFSAQYALLPGRLLVQAGAGRQVQYLHRLRDRYSFLYDLVSSRWISTSAAVGPSSSVQADLGLVYYLTPPLSLSAGLYGRWSDHVLLPEDEYRTKDGLDGPGIETGALLGQYRAGEAKAYGLELGLRWEGGPWQVWLSYAGGRSLNRIPSLGETRFRPSRYDVPRSLRSVANYAGERWSFGFALDVRSGYPYSVPVARYALGDPLGGEPVRYLYRPEINNGRLPPYARLDVSAGRRFQWLRVPWRIQLHLYNAANRRNIVDRAYDPADEVVEADDRQGLPILPLFELQLEL